MKLNIKVLQIAMLRKGLTSKMLAKNIGCTYNTILNYLNKNTQPNAPMLCRIAKELDVDVTDLIE